MMAESERTSTTAGDGAPRPDHPAAVGATAASRSEEEGEDSEWEYEYSSTETETYYLTVELSYPEFKSAAPPNPHHSRGGYYKKWLTRAQDTTDPAQARSQNRPPNVPPNHDDNDDEPVPGVDDDMPEIDPSLRIDGASGVNNGAQPPAGERSRRGQDDVRQNEDDGDQSDADDSGPLQDIQILDLHSQKPVISYRGRVFEGQWAEMIGTDLILAQQEAESEGQLPTLRNLPGGVDILAASASRILTTKKTLEPRVPEKDDLAPIRAEWNINIPAGKHKDGERAQQADFLERLIALKIKRGDKDKVTVYAQDGEGKNFHDDKDPDYRPRRKRTTGKNIEGEEDTSRKKKRRSGRPTGRPSGRASRIPVGVPSEPAEPEALSIPTPKRWEDLEDGDEDDELEAIDEVEDDDDLSGEGGSDQKESGASDDNDDGDDDDEIDEDESFGEEDTVMTTR